MEVLRYLLTDLIRFIIKIFVYLFKFLWNLIPVFYLIIEIKFSRDTINLKEMEGSIIILNDTMFLPSAYRKFVYIHGNRIKYSTIIDSEANIEFNALIVKRTIEYCQWVEESNDYSTSYYIAWKDKPQKSPTRDRINPQKKFFTERKVISKILYVGDYLLDDSLFHEDPPLMRFKPSKEQIALFNISPMRKYFEYIGDGWFYHSYRSSLKKRIEELSNRPDIQILMEFLHSIISSYSLYSHNKADFSLKPTKRNTIDALFQYCKPGDQRMRFNVFAPESITAVGWLNGTVIQAKERKHLIIGSFAEGKKDLSTILQVALYYSKLSATVTHLIMSLYIILKINNYSNDYKKRSWYSVMAGFGIMIFKGVLWGKQYYNPYYWMSALAVVICSYYVFTNQLQAHNHRD